MRVQPPATRSLIVLEIAEELTLNRTAGSVTAFVDFRGRSLRLSSASTTAGIEAVASYKSDLAIVNPSAMLTLAVRGSGPFEQALPLRTIAVIPSRDEYLFAVHPRTGLSSFAEIAAKRPALRIGVRGGRDHSLHAMLDDVMRAHGFSRDDVAAWGGEFFYEGGVPTAETAKFKALVNGELDAIWDEGSDEWLDAGLDAGMRMLSLAEAAVKQLEALGYRRSAIARARHPRLEGDVLTVDFSGWAMFVRADLPDDDVESICAALAARVEGVPWQEDGALTMARMVGNAADAPYDAPLHPAAERYWKKTGALN